jgi:hypothetical protein
LSYPTILISNANQKGCKSKIQYRPELGTGAVLQVAEAAGDWYLLALSKQ